MGYRRLFAFLCVALGPAVGWAEEASAKKIDADGDGKVSFEEVRAKYPKITQEKFKARDKNGDGFLSGDERVISDQRIEQKKEDAKNAAEEKKKTAKPAVQKSAGPDPGQIFKKADKDSDGKVTWEELQAVAPKFSKTRFKQVDKDGDGAVSQDEAAALRKTVETAKAKSAQNDTDMVRLARKADADKSGSVTFEEMVAVAPNFPRTRFDQLDRNTDGVLSPADRAQAERDSKVAVDDHVVKLLETDADKDGKVTFDELTTAKAGFPRAAFDQADRNKDGVISAEDSKSKKK